ncbi:putative DNA modification/repair radical SAM protein [Thermoclostridium stercorarium]|uniref:putative DNA modification/repair radical SAM protein n=1 Tax=Thermoclostridium stercorarium TaxID=1510 RepID=UPI0005A1D9FF|nr:putative DNA modification/repair radical SAM protein [Thermoclostridium stercorarium]
MNLMEKLRILADSAKYDVSCASSGSGRKNTPGGIGNAYMAGICHSWADDGRCISLLKVLFSNACVYDCAYCINRVTNNIPRATFTPEELAELTIQFYRRNYIEGLFLSSAVLKSPDYTMELLIKTLKLLRVNYRFNGYIHVKVIPGADPVLIDQAGLYADRVSVNIELPTRKSLQMLAPHKQHEHIITPMSYIHQRILEFNEDKRKIRHTPVFAPAGQSTQMIIGATPESDAQILRLAEYLYRNFGLKRVYYSAYVPVNQHPNLPAIYTEPPLLREHRIYQADWLLRYYGFQASELVDEFHQNLDLDVDPKCGWALRNLHLFPVEINKAPYEMLLRVPGIGVKSALKIVKARRLGSISYDDLKRFRVVLKRAKYFITCKGKYYGNVPFKSESIRNSLVETEDTVLYEQLRMF